MPAFSYVLKHRGLLGLPGVTHASKKTVEELLLKDAEEHHCFFNQAGFHNHVSHHLLAAYDLGASEGHLRKIYADATKLQRPIFAEEQDKKINVDKENWKQYLGNQSAYGSFVKFFGDAIAELGVGGTLEKYVFSEEANVIGVDMLNRLMAGAVHPFIATGYGMEFGNDTLVATGLSQAAIHNNLSNFHLDKSPPAKSVTLMELLEQIYTSDILKPVPYDRDAFINPRMRAVLANGGAAEIERLCAGWHISDTISDEELTQKCEELIWATTLLTFSTGRPGRTPRLDFFLVHLLNSALFVQPFCRVINQQAHKAALLRAYLPVMMLLMLMRGRPRIDAALLMSYNAVPRAPLAAFPKPGPQALGDPADDADYNPWPGLIEGVRYHSDSHVLKAMRTLAFGAQYYGLTPPGGVIGAFRKGEDGKEVETIPGIGKADGTVFVRAAGVLMDRLGWTGYGQEEKSWDRSALGWDEAWDKED